MYSRRAANILIVIVLIVAFFFLSEYLGIFALAALTTLLYAPLQDWFLKRGKRVAKFATTLTIISVVLSLLIPLSIITGLIIAQLGEAAASIQDGSADKAFTGFSETTTNTFNSLGISISAESLTASITSFAKESIPKVINFLLESTSSIVAFIPGAIIYFMLLALMLSKKTEIINAFRRLSPFEDSVNNEYLTKVGNMGISMAKCTFLIALVVAAICSFTFWLIGFQYIFVWFLFLTVLSLIPLGSGIITFPLGIFLLLIGNTWQGALILGVQILILNNVDNVLRPRLAPKGNTVPGALILVATFAGVAYFGLFGVVYGPIIMVLIYTSIELYDRNRTRGLPVKH